MTTCRMLLFCAPLLVSLAVSCRHPPGGGGVGDGHAHRGGHAHATTPFADTKDYIAHLEKEDRAAWQKPDDVVASLGLKGSETLVDLGAGSGYFTFRFAGALPQGKVVAVDIDPAMLEHMRRRSEASGIGNIEVVQAGPDDPRVPARPDVVFMCNVLHHVEQPAPWLARVTSAMASGARLVIIEFKMGKLPMGPPDAMKIPGPDVIALARGAGCELIRQNTSLLPYQDVFIFAKR